MYTQKELDLKDGTVKDKKEKDRSGEDQEENKDLFWDSLSLASDLGFLIAFPLVGGVLLGGYLDKRLGTGSDLTLIFLMLGIIVSGFNIYRVIKRIIK